MTSASTFLLGDILMQAGLPAGVVNILAGWRRCRRTDGQPSLVEMVSFTGSTRVGKMTMASVAQSLKKVRWSSVARTARSFSPTPNLKAAPDAAVVRRFFNAGECCNAGSRLIVHGGDRR